MKLDSKTYKAYRKTTNKKYKYLCHAPFNTLSFKQKGDVTACCYNSDDFCGDLNKNSIFEILNNEDRGIFQKKIKNLILPSGCSVCLNHFQNSDFQNIATRWYPEKINKNGYPSNLEFKISNKCNLNCIMCLRTLCEENNAICTPYNDKFFKDIEIIIPYLENTTFNGGEPMLIKEYLELWKKIKELNKNCRITIHTNCTLIPPDLKKLLLEGGFSIIVSIDSFEKTKYEEIRVNASFENTWKNLQFYLEHSEKYGNTVKLNFCPMKSNWQEIPGIIEFCNIQKIDFNFSYVFFPFTLSLYNSDFNELKEIINFFNTESVNMTDCENTQKLKSFSKDLSSFNQQIKNENKYYQSKKEVFNFIFKTLRLSPKRESELNNINTLLPEGTYFNMFMWIGPAFIKKLSDILNDLKIDELKNNILCLKQK